jgi:hypothetical protein
MHITQEYRPISNYQMQITSNSNSDIMKQLQIYQ